jgi:SH3-like domain-containing protein
VAILGVLAAMSWTQDTPKPTSEFPFVGQVNTAQLNVRVLPKVDPSSTVVAVLKEGDEVTVVGEKEGWFEVLPPKGAWTWVFAKNLQIEGEWGTTLSDCPVRTDSRVNATQVATLKTGVKVRVIKEHLSWCKIDAGDAVHFWVGKKYIRSARSAEAKSAAPKKSEDSEAQAKIREAEELISKQNEALSKGEITQIDFEPIATMFDEAATLAKDAATRQYAESNAKIYRKMQNLLVAIKGPMKTMDEQKKQLEELMAKADAAQRNVKTFAFRGYVDTTGAFMLNRPGTHKLISEDKKIVCFLKIREDDAKMLEKLNDHYQKYVGVNGTVIQNPQGWPGYNVVVVDEIQIVTPEEGMFLLGDETLQK